MATRISGASMASPVSRSAETGTAASAASGASPMACAIRSSRRTKAASSPRRSSMSPMRGELVLYARYLDDKNQFITPIPVIQRGTDNFSAYPGLRSAHGDLQQRGHSACAARWLSGRRHHADLAEGRGAQMLFVGANYDQELDNGWSITNKLLANGGDVDTNALFSGSNPATLIDELYTIPTDLGGFALPAGSATATFVGGGAVRGRSERHPPGLVVHPQGTAEHQQRFSPEQGAVRRQHADARPVSRLLRDGRRMGARQPDVHDQRTECAADHGELRRAAARRSCAPTSRASSTTAASTSRSTVTRSTARSIYPIPGASTNGCWTPRCATRTRTPPTTSATCTQRRSRWQSADDLQQRRAACATERSPITDYDEDFTSWTVGANYSFTDSMSAYVRVNSGGHFLDFDNGIRGSTTGNTPPDAGNSTTMKSASSSRTTCSMPTSARTSATSPACCISPPTTGGAPVGERAFRMAPNRRASTSSARITPGENFRFQVVANYLDGEYTDYDACFPYTNVVTGDGCAPIEGQQLQRQPKLRYMLTPSYRLPSDRRRHRGLRHLHLRRRSHAGSVRAAATRHLRDLGFRHHRERRRELAVLAARHERVR